jgi:hypothetical protein
MIGVISLIASAAASACPICLGPLPEPPLAERLHESDRAIIVQSIAGDPSRFRITTVIKGPGAVGEELVIATRVRSTLDGDERTQTTLFILEAEPRGWSNLGNIDPNWAEMLRQWSALEISDKLNIDQRRQRLAYFARYLEHREPLVAAAAYAELARAPYAGYRAIRAALDRERLWRWIDDPTLANRHSLYLMLVGVIGDEIDGALVERRMADAHRTHASADLAALIAADLELNGGRRVAFVERTYLLDRDSTGDEIAAALLALSVHGNAPGAVPRERVIAAYRLLIRERKPLAGFVAQDLAAWNDWSAVPEYSALLKSDTLHIASRIAIVNFLKASHHRGDSTTRAPPIITPAGPTL